MYDLSNSIHGTLKLNKNTLVFLIKIHFTIIQISQDYYNEILFNLKQKFKRFLKILQSSLFSAGLNSSFWYHKMMVIIT